MSWMKKSALLASITSVALVGAACGNNEEGGAAEGGDALSGKVVMDGSSTVFPIMEAVAEEFSAEQPEVEVTVGVSGTGGGFKRFVTGETDFSNASREIKEEEAAEAEKNGVEFTQLSVALDGLSLVVNPANDWAQDITIEELNKMWTDTSVKTWKDVRSDWPDEEISFFAPGKDSGTFDFFNEAVLDDTDIREDAQLSEDDNVLVTGVAGTEGAIGFFGYAYYIENQDTLRAMAVEGVEPTPETINDLSYPLSREIYTYVNNASLKDKEQVAEFARFMNENAGALSEEVGYVGMEQARYDENMKMIDEIAGE
ncbi:phosphate ABC transporter substrate-binding protein PstS family protein [Exiguobacterium profundum]|uniref:PstS family phosphate ABC transporter substrate-binding protein n=1 Tax=Exiguobacterium TaxID=33986 RepID=UPI0018C3B466|nr:MULTISPECIES: PstS family phosphate ABC transporter substrate-binding protein [Exiguobacterium]MBG0917337.1 PstS family phosphate ABC transporter substrate-binding protein [Exiguobacterium sp. SRB7LM]MCT4799530.1 PstS family phosphate ABC transporter substrate-binding protein [Exiguobacterium profundum]MCV9899580.1 PstS family phosphate ABC transporter substrate-binding protein [Exiguobacterium sp. N5]QPI68802.1 PstS family phosphate ABC transporter substrate-binding protein [Exiguobacterium